MNPITKTAEMPDKRALLSTLWVFAMLNYLYCDVMSLMDSEFLKQYMTGNVGGIHITQSFLLGAAVLMEIPIAMVLLSRVLGYKANRWANITAAVVTILFVIGGGSVTLSYIFFATIEVVCMLLIIWYAWKWPKQEV